MKKIITMFVAALISAMLFAGTETTVYYTASTSVIGTYTVKLNVNFKGDGDDWHQYTMTKTERTYNGDPVYSYTYTDAYNGVGVMQFQLYDGATWKSEKKPISSWTSVGTYNGKMYVHSTETWVAPPAADPTAKYYITGDSALVVDAGAGIGKKWDPQAIKATSDSHVLSNLKAGIEYKLKLTADGTWNTAIGFADLSSVADGLSGDKDGNICFTLTTAGNVTVTYTNTTFTVTGSFAPVPKRLIKFVPSEEWAYADAKFAAWIWGKNITSQWTEFFVPVSAGNDTLQVEVVANADSIDFVRISPKASKPAWGNEGENVVVWGEMKDKLYADSSVWTVIGWDHGQWKAYDRPCQEFGLLIDGVYQKGKRNVNQSEWLEYVLHSVELTAGQQLQIKNNCNGDIWVISKFANTSHTFAIENSKYIVDKDGKYDFYFKFIYGADEIYISKEGEYTTAVRSQCTDVMMQAFYNESYDNTKPGVADSWALGDTKWTTLYAQADSIGKYFDLIWLPPSANGDGAGYHPKNYSNQSSNWGTVNDLHALIDKFHSTGTKVIADIVINHCQSSTGWMGFPEFDFGTYGKFQPKGSWICQNDEANTDPGSDAQGQATGPYDDGENWSGARDWAHSNVEVQAMFKAYLQWMRDVMGYDGWRYDKGDGFNNWHHDNYNKASNPYIAFMECYSGTDEIKWRIEQANYNLMALDFGTKWDVFNSFAGWNYGCYRGGGLLGQNWGRYAVEFIESHDWFLRPDNENEFGGRGNSLTETMKCRLLQANAFLLSMPGIPCVFYPHWKKYDGFLKPMIEARKLAGVHSESEVKDEYVSDYGTGYQATIVGKDGYLILCLGDKAHQNFDGYKLMASYYETNDAGLGKDASYQIWVNRTTPLPTGMEEVEEQPVVKGEKFLRDGQLYIRMGERIYDATGKLINK